MHIALMGRARAGKDSIAERLVSKHGYARVAFADPLKAIARHANPVVDLTSQWAPRGLDDVLSLCGESQAKTLYPEYRAFLQRLGEAVRNELGEYVWLDKGLCTARWHMVQGRPVVITDVRYLNEATALRHLGFTMVKVVRPSLSLRGSQHISETELDTYEYDRLVVNDQSIDALHEAVDLLTIP